MRTKIYSLVDPRTNRVRYIGKTKNSLEWRLRRHINDANKEQPTNHRLRWLRLLLRSNLLPVIVLIEECDGDGVPEERYHIHLARVDGLNLINSTDGGEGPTEITEELRQKLSRAAKGRKWTPEMREKLVPLIAERSRRPEHIAFVRQLGHANRGKARTKEQRERISAVQRGRKATAQTRAKLSAARRGKPWSEHRRANPVTNKGFRFTPEQRARMSVARKGKPALAQRKYTPDQEIQICEEYKAGGVTKAIAAKWGTKHWMITSILRRHGIPPRPHRLTPEQVAKMAASKRGVKLSAEHRQKLGGGWRGKKRGPFTDEHRRKLSLSHTGKKQSPEFVASRIAAALHAKQRKLAAVLLGVGD